MIIWVALAVLAAILTALALYPGELSWLSRRGTRWLYNRAAAGYGRKHRRHDYVACDRFIADAARPLAAARAEVRVLDLGCGTGRAALAAAAVLGGGAHFTGVDFSPAMLGVFCRHREARELLAAGRLELHPADVASWLQARDAGAQGEFHLVLLMEVGEFLPRFPDLLPLVRQLCARDAVLLMTRPAGLWAWCFPLRAQRLPALTRALGKAGFELVRRQRWRGRYELLACRRATP